MRIDNDLAQLKLSSRCLFGPLLLLRLANSLLEADKPDGADWEGHSDTSKPATNNRPSTCELAQYEYEEGWTLSLWHLDTVEQEMKGQVRPNCALDGSQERKSHHVSAWQPPCREKNDDLVFSLRTHPHSAVLLCRIAFPYYPHPPSLVDV